MNTPIPEDKLFFYWGRTVFCMRTNENDGGVMNTEEMLKLTGLKML
jgi:hypothetical protein